MQVKLIYNKMEKVLNEKESLDLIVKTIEQTRRRVEKNAGLPMLIFGYLSVLTSLVVGFFFSRTGDYRYHILWAAIPVLGWILFAITGKNRSRETEVPRTHIGVLIGHLWLLITGVMVLCMAAAFLLRGFAAPFIFVLLTGLGVAITGLVVRYKPFIVCGILGILLSFAFLWLTGLWLFPLLALAFAVMMVIPGHLLQHGLHKNRAV